MACQRENKKIRGVEIDVVQRSLRISRWDRISNGERWKQRKFVSYLKETS